MAYVFIDFIFNNKKLFNDRKVNIEIENVSGTEQVKIKTSTPVTVSSINKTVPKKNESLSGVEPEIRRELGDLLNTSSDGLNEVKTENGVMVDLKDRFRTAPVATINENGEVVIQDYVIPPSKQP